MSQKRHVMHGRDHLPNGADPIGAGTDIDLGRYVIAAVPLMRNLWVGGHDPEGSGAGAVTHVACPLAAAAAPAPADKKFYSDSLLPAPTDVFPSYIGYIGSLFSAIDTEVECSGVQFFRATGSGTVDVALWKYSDPGTRLAHGTGMSGLGWNEVYFDDPHLLSPSQAYTACWFVAAGGGGRIRQSPPPAPPYEAPGLAQSGTPAGWTFTYSDPGTTSTMPSYATAEDHFVGPIVNHEPVPPAQVYVVATAKAGTDDGVHVIRTELGDGVIDVYWSASSATVAVDVFAMGTDPGDTQPCESEQYRLLGSCVVETP